MVAPGGAIVWLSRGIGPVPARPSGADSGGGAGSEPAAILAVSACAAAVAAAGVAGLAGGTADGVPWGRGREAGPSAAEPGTA